MSRNGSKVAFIVAEVLSQPFWHAIINICHFTTFYNLSIILEEYKTYFYFFNPEMVFYLLM